MSDHESVGRQPTWEGAVVGFLAGVELGMIPREQVIPEMGLVCRDLIRSGMLANLGELQGYLRQRESFVQLVAQPFRQEEMSSPDIKCIDIATREPRDHWLMISVGTHEAAHQLQLLSMSDDVNEATLADNTGMLVFAPSKGQE